MMQKSTKLRRLPSCMEIPLLAIFRNVLAGDGRTGEITAAKWTCCVYQKEDRALAGPDPGRKHGERSPRTNGHFFGPDWLPRKRRTNSGRISRG